MTKLPSAVVLSAWAQPKCTSPRPLPHTLPLMLPAPFNWVALLLTARAIQLPYSCGSTDV